MTGDVQEVELVGGASHLGQVVRVGETVRRPLSPHAAQVHRLLEHLERVGFDGAPRFLGIDEQGREVLSWVPGDVALAPLPAWSRAEATARSVAVLLRDFHAATADFDPGPAEGWAAYVPAPWNTGRRICHNDTVRSNIVCRDGVAVALIDFDRAAPSTVPYELAIAVGQWLPLRGEEDPDDGSSGPRTAHRLRDFLDACGLGPGERLEVLDIVVGNEDRSATTLTALRDSGAPAYVALFEGGAWDRIQQRRSWLAAHRDLLTEALS